MSVHSAVFICVHERLIELGVPGEIEAGLDIGGMGVKEALHGRRRRLLALDRAEGIKPDPFKLGGLGIGHRRKGDERHHDEEYDRFAQLH